MPFDHRFGSIELEIRVKWGIPEKNPKIVVLLPCYNEETAIRSVVSGFRKVLPDATV